MFTVERGEAQQRFVYSLFFCSLVKFINALCSCVPTLRCSLV